MGAIRGVCALALLSALSGCGSSASTPSPPVASYVGRPQGSNAFVAVVAGKANLVVYVCDGQHGLGDLFEARRAGTTTTLRNSRGARVSVTIGQRAATGAFAAGGESRALRFRAEVARQPAGFYRVVGRVRGVRTSIGWVVLNAGEPREPGRLGTMRGCLSQDGSRSA